MLEGLQHFLLALEHGTVTAAARAAHLSQPAMTASLQRVEAVLGATLLERDRRGVRPTAAGEALVPHARAALAAVEDGRRAVEAVAELHAGEVRIGGGATACTYLLPPVLARFRARHPGVRFRVREAGSATIRGEVEAGALDLGIVSGRARPEEELWVRVELILVGPAGTPTPVPFVTLTRPAPSRALLERHFPEADVVMELSGLESVKANVRAGIGRALVSRAAAHHEIEAGRLVEVREARTPIERSFLLCHRGVARLSPAAAALRAMLLER